MLGRGMLALASQAACAHKRPQSEGSMWQLMLRLHKRAYSCLGMRLLVTAFPHHAVEPP